MRPYTETTHGRCRGFFFSLVSPLFFPLSWCVSFNSNNCSNARTMFITQLKDILVEEDNTDSIAWLPHGKSFMVLNRKKFVDQVLPRYLCKATKYTSFTRKLSRWNFIRVANGPDEGAWYNKVRTLQTFSPLNDGRVLLGSVRHGTNFLHLLANLVLPTVFVVSASCRSDRVVPTKTLSRGHSFSTMPADLLFLPLSSFLPSFLNLSTRLDSTRLDSTRLGSVALHP